MFASFLIIVNASHPQLLVFINLNYSIIQEANRKVNPFFNEHPV